MQLIHDHVGLIVTPDIDLRLFMNDWQFGFAVNENERLSLQFFDQHGDAVHKILFVDQSNVEAYQTLVKKFKAEEQAHDLEIKALKNEVFETDSHELDLKAFREDWINLQNTHEFHGMLRKHKISRTRALQLAPDGYADKISVDTVKQKLQNASLQHTEIMVFTGSPGCIQIHTGQIKKLVETGPWFNVLDPEFNMHLKLDGIDSAWLVKKPTTDGLVHSIEVFDAKGNTIVQFFGKRKPGLPESQAWRSILLN